MGRHLLWPLPSNVSTQCAKDISGYFPPSNGASGNQTRNVTLAGLQMLDAWGKSTSDLLALPPSIQLMGDYDECMRLRRTGHDVHYCYVEGFEALDRNTSGIATELTPVASLGVCLPSSCRQHSVIDLVRNITGRIAPGLFVKLEAHCAHPSAWTPWAIAAAAVCSVLAGLVVAGTALHWWLSSRTRPHRPLRPLAQGGTGRGSLQNPDNAPEELHAPGADGASKDGGHDARPTSPVQGRSSEDRPGSPGESERLLPDSGAAPRRRQPAAVRGLLAFSLGRNVDLLLGTQRPDGGINCFDGMRAISMMWVILGHNWLWIAKRWPENMETMLAVANRVTFQPIANTNYAVDTFFFISGFLVCYRFPWFKFYAHRYIRLTPTYLFVMMLFVHMTQMWGDGPVFYHEQDILPQDGCVGVARSSCGCPQYWWTNLLYIQNFYPAGDQNDECMSWTWYLANDMQMYIVSPLFILALHKSRRVGVALWALALTASIAVPFAIALGYKLAVDPFLEMPGMPFTPVHAGSADVFALVYNKPYCRIAPYLLGIMLAHVFRQRRWDKPGGPAVSRPLAACGWAATTGIAGLVLYCVTGTSAGLRSRSYSDVENALLLAFLRPLWGLALCWVTFWCFCRPRSLVNRLLSARAWLPVSRLTFGAYLIHPLVLNAFYNTLRKPLYYQDTVALYFYIGNLVTAYAAAAVTAVAVEFPLAELEKQFLL